jgi:hypothetical protein
MGSGLPWSVFGATAGSIVTIVQQLFGLYTPEQYGAVGDGVADDTAPMVAFEAARSANNGLGWLRNRYGVSAELQLGGGVVWTGTASAAGKSTVVAIGAIRSVCAVSQGAGRPNRFLSITWDGGRLAKWGVLALSDSNSTFTTCQFLNCLVDGERASLGSAPGVLSPVTQTGPGPALTVSLIDQVFSLFGAPTVRLRVGVGGARGAATLQMSTDGGGTYGPAQTIFAATQIGYPGGVNWATGTGVLVTAAADGFVGGTTYDFTSTIANSLNNVRHFQQCIAQNCGFVYAGAGVLADYPYNPVAAAGTVATVAGSNVVVGVGTQFLSFKARDGDGMRIVGLTNADGTPQRLMITVVLSDTIVIVDGAAPPIQAVAATNAWSIAVGAGYWDDVETGNQLDTVLDHCSALNCATGIRVGGLGGLHMTNPVVLFPAINGISIGTVFAN